MRSRGFWRDSPINSLCEHCSYTAFAKRCGPSSQTRRIASGSSRRKDNSTAVAASIRNDFDDTEGQKTSSLNRASFQRRSTFGTGEIELSHEELNMSERMKSKDDASTARSVKVFAGAGPASHRGGRPLLTGHRNLTTSRSPDATDARMSPEAYNFDLYARSTAFGRPKDSFRSVLNKQPPSDPLIRGPLNHALDPKSTATPDSKKSSDTDPPWAHLRRQDRLRRDPFQSQNSLGGENRTQRGELGIGARYRPLTNRPIPEIRSSSQADSSEQSSISQKVLGEKSFQDKFAKVAGQPLPESRSRFNADLTADSLFSEKALDEKAIEDGFSKVVGGHASASGSSEINNFKTRGSSSPGEDTDSPAKSQFKPMKASKASMGSKDSEPPKPLNMHLKAQIERGYGLDDRDARPNARAVARRGHERDKARRADQFIRNDGHEDHSDKATDLARSEEKRRRKLEKAARKASSMSTPVLLPQFISVSNLAFALKVKLEDFVEKMEDLGFEEVGYDFILNSEDAGLIAQEYNFEPIIERSAATLDMQARPPPEDLSKLPPRAPVVTIMGHVDHGKTTLLDYLRKSSVAAGEHGGITQHIGAFSVPMPSGKVITFLDTPGHAAFLSMRQRGANITDIVILVVAADDSVKPQTIEAIKHAKAAKVPIIVAINKIDKEGTDVQRVKQDLARNGVEVEDFGGDTQAVCVSGKTGEGMDKLEEAAVALSELLDLRADTDGPAEGWVVEASIKSMGKVATVLVRRGTMRPGDFIVAGMTWARIRCLRNEAGVEIDEAGPGTPVEVDGWKRQPLAGDEVLQAPSEQRAKSVVDYRLEREETEKLAQDMVAINDTRREYQERREAEKEAKLLAEESEDSEDPAPVPKPEEEPKPTGPKKINFIIKADVSGSVEAVVDYITPIGNGEVQPHILRSGVGQVSEFDVEHAAAAGGYLINFNTSIEPHISHLAEMAKVKIIDHNIIYKLVDDVRAILSESLPPLVTYKVLGEADIVQIFEISLKGRKTKGVAGCKVRNGVVSRNDKVRVWRTGEKIFEGSLSSLKNVKKDVLEMRKGNECGMSFEDWRDFQVGDLVQTYEVMQEKRYL